MISDDQCHHQVSGHLSLVTGHVSLQPHSSDDLLHCSVVSVMDQAQLSTAHS